MASLRQYSTRSQCGAGCTSYESGPRGSKWSTSRRESGSADVSAMMNRSTKDATWYTFRLRRRCLDCARTATVDVRAYVQTQECMIAPSPSRSHARVIALGRSCDCTWK
eukprot:302603-Pleurochrysis_carterae.AAC.3